MTRRNLLCIVAFALLLSTVLLSCKKTNMKLVYSGKDLTKDASIVRDKDIKGASINIINSKNWKLYAGATVETIDLSKPILEGSDEGKFSIGVPNESRSYFLLATEKGNAILAERHLPMSGGYNFRDLGGFKTQDGRYTKWGKIFRSDDLYNLTDSDLKYLASIPLVSVVDFRSEEEIEKAPDRDPSSVKSNYKLSITPGDVMAFEKLMKQSEEEMEKTMMDLNVSLVSQEACLNSYREFFALLQSDEEVPLLFHCSAGKDRTGMAGALVLYALGVDEKTIVEDYISSNDYLGDKYTQLKEEHPSMTPLFEVRKKYLLAGLDKIVAEHGSIDTFLTNILDVDIDKMRVKYLY